MKILLLVISIFSALNGLCQDCIPHHIDSLDYDEAMDEISHCKANSPFSFYAKTGDILYAAGKNTEAIVAYENARMYDTAHSSLNQNLTTSYSNTDNSAKELIIKDLNSVKHVFFNPKMVNLWTVVSLGLWLVFIVSFLRMIGFKKPLSKWFLASLIPAFLFSVLTYFSFDSTQVGIVTKDDTGGKEFSSETAENTSILNQGYKLEILELGPDWCKVRLATNKTCWVKTESLKMVGE